MASPRRLVWSPEAEQDLFDIWTYLAREASPEIADAQLRAIDRASANLVEWPQSGRARDELASEIRSVVAAPYVVFHRVTASAIQIVRVLHGRRDIDAIFADD
jgi:toxin ParE1/3/4